MSEGRQQQELDALRARLNLCLRVFQDPPEGMDSRLGATAAISAIVKYFLAIGIEPRLLSPLYFAAEDWTNALKTDASKPMGIAIKMGRAARVVDILRSHDYTLGAALKAVEKTTGGQIGAEQLKTFRKNVRSGRAGEDAIRAYQDTLHLARALEMMPPKVAAAIALSTLEQSEVLGVKAQKPRS